MKTSDKVTGFVMLILLCSLFIGGLAGTLNMILYRTIGVDDSITKWDISKVNDDEFVLSYVYSNKITQKEYIVERTIDGEQYEIIKDKSNFKVTYVGYFPGSPHIERVDPRRPLLLVVAGIVLIAFGIRRNILFLKGKLSTQEFT
jgi:hypothetical protein